MKAKSLLAGFLAAAFLVLILAAVLPASLRWPLLPPAETQIGLALWSVRTYEVLVQGLLLLGGALAVLLLLGRHVPEEAGP